MNSKTKIILSITGIMILLIIMIGVSYAYFSANLTGGEEATTITVTGGTMNIIYNGGANINLSNIIPSDNSAVTKTFTVTGNNTTDIEMKYQINLVIELNTFSEDALTYKLLSTNTDNNGTVAPNITALTNIGTGAKTIDLGVGEFDSPTGGNKVHTYNLEIYFLNANYNQNEDQGKEIKAHIEIEESRGDKPKLLSTDLLNQYGGVDSIIEAPAGTFSSTSTANESVIYKMTDDYGTSYYYRGAVENNYLVFANMCWRIVRVTGNGAIKLALYNYNPNSVDNPCDVSQDGGTNAFARYSGSTYSSYYNSSNVDASAIGFMSGDYNTFALTNTSSTLSFYDELAFHYSSTYTLDENENIFHLSGNSVQYTWKDSFDVLISNYPYTCNSQDPAKKCSKLYKVTGYISDIEANVTVYTRNSTSYLQAHTNSKKSDILKNLELWYLSKLVDYDSYLADVIWCNDKSLDTIYYPQSGQNGYGKSNISNYSSRGRVLSTLPSLICPSDTSGEKLSKFTADETAYGNESLDYKIGLLTADEVAIAGGVRDSSNSTYYLYKNANMSWWTMTPFQSYLETSYNFFVNYYQQSHMLSGMLVDRQMGLRPSIALISTTQVIGNGTNSNPYVVVSS